MCLVDVLREIMDVDVNYTINGLNNLLMENNIEYTITLEILAILPDEEFSVMTIKEGEDRVTFIRRKGQRVVKLPPNIPH